LTVWHCWATFGSGARFGCDGSLAGLIAEAISVKTLWNWLTAGKAAGGGVDETKLAKASAPMVEQLEERCLMAAPPHVISAIADNRGQLVLKFDQKLAANTVNKNSVKVTKATSGADKAVSAVIKYSAKAKTLTVTSNLPANTVYKVRLISKLIKNGSGVKLDGEFKGADKRSGNNRPGGDYFMMTAAVPASVDPVARFTTTYGVIDVKLYANGDRATPITVANFIGYANARDWDGTVFHRSVNDFVIQGGGFNVDSSNRYAPVHDDAPTITNEPKNDDRPGNPGNIRGTIAMARTDDQLPETDDFDTASDQWYFNVGDNTELDTNHGGFTVFGEIAGNRAAGLAVMDKINGLDEVNAGGAFAQLPVKSTTPIFATTPPNLDPNRDSVFVTRLAMLAKVVKGVKVS
jgi:cyclophilin family peptidyl-prolyl cis-trans isomerase